MYPCWKAKLDFPRSVSYVLLPHFILFIIWGISVVLIMIRTRVCWVRSATVTSVLCCFVGSQKEICNGYSLFLEMFQTVATSSLPTARTWSTPWSPPLTRSAPSLSVQSLISWQPIRTGPQLFKVKSTCWSLIRPVKNAGSILPWLARLRSTMFASTRSKNYFQLLIPLFCSG